MIRPLKITFFAILGFVALLAALAVSLTYFIDANAYKTRIQGAASEALDMEVGIDGRLGIGFYPGINISMHDVHIRNRGRDLIVAEKVRIGLELLPLLRNEVRIKGVWLIGPRVTVEQDAAGRYNFNKPKGAETPLPAVTLEKISISGGRFLYMDRGSGGKVNAEDCSVQLRHLQLAGKADDVIRALSFAAKLHCHTVRTEKYAASDLNLTAKANNGVFDLKPITLNIFGGEGSGSIRADYSGAYPHYHVRFGLPQLRIEELLKAQSSNAILSGAMAFSMNLSMHGKSVQQMKQSAAGDVLLQGRSLKLHGYDLDLELDRYASSQNFNMLDMGAFLIAGPIGTAVTKGHDFANVLAGSGGSGTIHTFVSHWKVRRGVMHAQDVAMATNRHRMAVLGRLDMVRSRFVNLTLALINRQGCAEVQQKISGSFERPVVQKPNILKSVAGPVLSLLKKGAKLLPGGGCKVIYAGSVAPPR